MAVKRKKRFRGVVLTLIFCAASFAGGHYYHYWKTFKQSEYTVNVVDVVDGDTLDIEWFGSVSRLRIVGIDTLETRKNKKLREQAETWNLTPEQALEIGKQAKELAQSRLNGKSVRIRFPSGQIERDSFGRLLAYVYVGDTDFGKTLIEEGLAYTRTEAHLRERFYEWPMIQAKNDKKGIHGRSSN